MKFDNLGNPIEDTSDPSYTHYKLTKGWTKYLPDDIQKNLEQTFPVGLNEVNNNLGVTASNPHIETLYQKYMAGDLTGGDRLFAQDLFGADGKSPNQWMLANIGQTLSRNVSPGDTRDFAQWQTNPGAMNTYEGTMQNIKDMYGAQGVAGTDQTGTSAASRYGWSVNPTAAATLNANTPAAQHARDPGNDNTLAMLAALAGGLGFVGAGGLGANFAADGGAGLLGGSAGEGTLLGGAGADMFGGTAGMTAADLAAADAAGGLLPAYGTNAAYAAGLGGTTGTSLFDTMSLPNPFTSQPNALGSGLYDLTSGVPSGLTANAVGEVAPATLNQIIGQTTGALTSTGAAAGELLPGINAVYDFSLGQYVPAITNGAGELVAATTLGGSGGSDWWSRLWNQLTPGNLPRAVSTAANAVVDAAGVPDGNGLGDLAKLIGAGLGGLAGATDGTEQAGTTTTTEEPWGPQQPYLLDMFEKAKALSGGTDPLSAAANANYQTLLAGPTTNPYAGVDNPYLQKTIDNATGDFMRGFMPLQNQANMASGSFGNSGVAQTYGDAAQKGIGNIATNMRFQDYAQQQALAENAVNRTTSATNNANTFAYQPVQNYAGALRGTYGGSTSTPYYTNPTAGILGGALAGSQIAKSIWG